MKPVIHSKKPIRTRIAKSRWYLVSRKKETSGWVFDVLLVAFNSARSAEQYAGEHGLTSLPQRGESILAREEDARAGLVKINYIESSNP